MEAIIEGGKSMGTTEFLPRVGSAVIVEKDGKILLGVRGKEPNRGKWVLPGGRIECFESIFGAAKRELREETGLEVDINGFVDFQEIINPPNEHRIIIFSHAIAVGGELKPSSDLKDVQFFSPDELQGLDVTETVSTVLKKFLGQEKKETGWSWFNMLKLIKQHMGAWRKRSGERTALINS